jgi:two-component system cell cycle response regulator
VHYGIAVPTDEVASGRLASHAWLGYLSAGLAATAGYYVIPAHGPGAVLRVMVYCLVSASAAVAILIGIRRHGPHARLPWVLLGLSQAMYAAADAVFYGANDLFAWLAFPSAADVLYLAHYPLVVAALTLLVRRRNPGRDRPGLLDAATLAVAAGLLSWLFVIVPQTRAGVPASVQTVLLAYPVMDLAMLAVAARLILAAGPKPLSFFLLIGNLAAIGTADTLYGLQRLAGTYQTGNYLDAIWLLGNLALGAAALHPTMRWLAGSAVPRDPTGGLLRIAVLPAIALVAPAMLLVRFFQRDLRDVPVIAAACAVLFLLAIARMAGLVADHHRVAITDGLTGLRTRRFLEAQLPVEVARARRTGGCVGLFIVDVDHFKAINDRYGHPVGDRVLAEIARRLRAGTRSGQVLARYGGEEFALLVPGADGPALASVAERLRSQVAGGPVAVADAAMSVTVSVGAAGFPLHTDCPVELVAIADRAMYAAKVRGRDRAIIGDVRPPMRRPIGIMREQASMVDYLQHIADEVDGWLSDQEHSRAIGRWAVTLCTEIGHDEATCLRTELAGRLHDVGKIVIDRRILCQPGVLSPDDWELLRQHPVHGERLVGALPGFAAVARIIRQHHERFDGRGYPARLYRLRIRPEARVLAVCDSWAAMRCNRPYQRARSEDEAREQLRLGRGTQFDPDVVDLFLDLHHRGLVGELRRGAGPLVVATALPGPATPAGPAAPAGAGPAAPSAQASAFQNISS